MKTYTLETLRAELRKILSHSALKQQDVSSATGVAQPTISMFLAGKRGLHGDAALKIEGFLRLWRKAAREDQMSA